MTIGGSGDDLCAGIIPTSDANYLLFGHSDSPADGDKSQASHGDDDFWIVKIDQNGSKIWDKRYGSENTEICNFAKELNNGDIVLGGRSISDPYADKSTANLGNQDGWLLRLDENGTKIWDYSYGGSGWDELKGVDILTGGNLLLFGESSSSNGTYKNSLSKGASDYWVLKVNEVNGIIIWDKSFGGHSLDYFHHGLVNDDGSFIMVGLSTNGSASTADRQSSAKTTRDLWVVKADANGSILWEKSFAGDSTKGMGWATRIISHDDGGYLIANTTNGVAENDVSRDPHHGDTLPDYWLLKIDALGNKVWDKRYGGYGSDYSENLISSSDGGYFLIGHSASIAGYDKAQTNQSYYSWDTDFWVLKLDEHGNKANTLYDPDGDVLTWTISGGADSSFFEINSTTGKISFSGANYANPQDTDQNNDYDVTIRATDTSGLSAEQTVRLSIEYPFDEAKGDSFLEAGLVAWYPFDGNASDMSGNGNHGTIYGAVPGTDRKGEAGKALSFDGTDDRVKIPHSLLNDRVQFTYNLWYKSTDASEPYAAFLSGANAQAYAGNSLLFSFESTKHIALFDTGGSAASYWGPTENLSNWLNIWRMLTLVRGSYGSTIYLDGQFYAKVHQINSSRGVDENGLWIGPDQDSVAGGWSPNQHLTGSVDDVRVYHRTLSEREVELLYQVTSANHFVDSAKDLEMIWVEPGTFTMGSPTSEAGRSSDETEHNVTLTKGFYLGKYEVTQAQYEIVMNGITGDLNATPSQFDGQPNRPVENVSWNDVQVFLARLNDQEAHNLPEGWAYILPTEAEWEYACRAGTTTAYSWGNSIATTNANYNPSDFNQTINVGQYVANPWGFHDMHGNVWEWTADAGVSSSSATQTDPFNLGTPSSNRVYRGGSYVSFSGSSRSAKRPSFLAPANRESFMGFRLAYRQITEPPTDLNSTTTLTIAENQQIGTIVGEFNATDPEGGAITYSLISGDGFILDENGTLKTSMKFDFETDSVHTIVVQVKDEMNASMLGTFTVTISDINEAPTFGGSDTITLSESTTTTSIFSTWDRTFGGSGEDKLANTIKTSDGGYLLAGRSESNASGEKSQDSRGGRDYWVVKLDAFGNKVWDRTFGGSGEDLCNGAVEVSSGGYLIYGVSFSSVDGDRTVERKGISDYWIVRIDNGNKLWDKAYGEIIIIIVTM